MNNSDKRESTIDSGRALAVVIAILTTVVGAVIWFITVEALNSNPALLGGAVAMTFAGPTAILLAKTMKPTIDADLPCETASNDAGRSTFPKYRDGPHEGISSATWM